MSGCFRSPASAASGSPASLIAILPDAYHGRGHHGVGRGSEQCRRAWAAGHRRPVETGAARSAARARPHGLGPTDGPTRSASPGPGRRAASGRSDRAAASASSSGVFGPAQPEIGVQHASQQRHGRTRSQPNAGQAGQCRGDRHVIDRPRRLEHEPRISVVHRTRRSRDPGGAAWPAGWPSARRPTSSLAAIFQAGDFPDPTSPMTPAWRR